MATSKPQKSNTNLTKSERFRKNKQAFTETIGDPFQIEPIQGTYATFKAKSGLKVAGVDIDAAPGSVNGARPCISDYFCDVEAAIKDGLDKFSKEFREPTQVEFIFATTYITEDTKYCQFTQQERAKLEQIIGNLLVARGISPASKYFTTMRR